MRKKKLTRAVLAIASGAMMFQLGVGACVRAAQIFNPCETVLAGCTQQQLDFLSRSIPDFTYDPSCTIPGQCGDLPFADFSGGLFGG